MAKQTKIEPQGFMVGYARVSTADQNLDLQIEALRKAGVKEDNLHVEKVSGAASKRPALDLAIMDLRPGDTLLVWRLDRFARSMRDLYARLDRVYAKGAKFRSLTESFDFDTFTGQVRPRHPWACGRAGTPDHRPPHQGRYRHLEGQSQGPWQRSVGQAGHSQRGAGQRGWPDAKPQGQAHERPCRRQALQGFDADHISALRAEPLGQGWPSVHP